MLSKVLARSVEEMAKAVARLHDLKHYRPRPDFGRRDGISFHVSRDSFPAQAETAAACTLFGTALAGIPASTIHTITGAIIGVGSNQRLSAIRWGIAGKVVWAWLLTIPLSASLAAFIYSLFRLFGLS